MLTPRIWNQSGLIGNGTIPGAVCPPPLASAAAAPGATAAPAPALARNMPGSPPQASRPAVDPAPPAPAAAAPTQEADPAPSSNTVVPRRAAATPRTPPTSRASRVAEHAPRDPGLLRASVNLTDNDPQSRPDSDPGYARHLVRRGENFWTIARRYYGSGGYYKALWAANRDQVTAPDQLTVGMAIVVPPVSDLDPSLIEAPRPASAPARATPDERVLRTWSAVKSAPASALRDGSGARP
jgi:nucleoid-associated protein YgaU